MVLAELPAVDPGFVGVSVGLFCSVDGYLVAGVVTASCLANTS